MSANQATPASHSHRSRKQRISLIASGITIAAVALWFSYLTLDFRNKSAPTAIEAFIPGNSSVRMLDTTAKAIDHFSTEALRDKEKLAHFRDLCGAHPPGLDDTSSPPTLTAPVLVLQATNYKGNLCLQENDYKDVGKIKITALAADTAQGDPPVHGQLVKMEVRVEKAEYIIQYLALLATILSGALFGALFSN